MRTKTIDHFLRATWQAVSKMYNEEASQIWSNDGHWIDTFEY